jgi:hypothetical protein
LNPETTSAELAQETAALPASEGQKERVRDLFLSMDKALRLMRLYEPSNKNYLAAVDGLAQKFTAYLADSGQLLASVTAEGFLAADELHLKGAKREASIPFRLYRDGVRSLRFLKGLERQEVARLLEAFEVQPDSPGRFDEDMATILWGQNFHRIEVFSVDEIGTAGARAAGSGDSPGMASDLSGKLQGLLDSMKGSLFPARDGDQETSYQLATGKLDLLEMQRLSRSPDRLEEAGSLVEVSEESLARLRAELQADGDGGFVRRVLDVLLHLLLVGPCTLPQKETPEILWHFLRHMLEEGDVAGVNEVLDRIAAPGPNAPEASRDLLGKALARLAAEESLALLAAAARSKRASGPPAFQRLLQRLPTSTLRYLARQTRDLPAGPLKEAWHQVLISRSSEDPPSLFIYLEYEGGERTVEAVQAALEAAKIPGAGGFLRSLLAHNEERVRVDALKTCSALSGLLQRDLLQLGLADPSPRVRVAAIRVVEASKDRSFLPILEKRLLGGAQDNDEAIRLVHAVAALGGEAAAGCLRKLLFPKRGWLSFSRGSMRSQNWLRAAVLALHDVADRGVQELLVDGTLSPDSRLAEACATVLAKINQKRRGGK